MKDKLEIRSKTAIFLDGRPLSSYEYDNAFSINGYVIAYNNSSFTIYGSAGKIILYHDYKVLSVNDLGYIIVEANELKGVFFCDGQSVLPISFNEILLNDEGIIVNKDGKYGVYSYEGKLIVQEIFDSVSFLKDGISVCTNSLKGLYSYSGKQIVPQLFSKIFFEKEAIKVCKDDCWGAYSYDGNLLIPPSHGYLDFKDRVAIEFKNGKYGACSYDGTLHLESIYNLISCKKNGLLVWNDTCCGFFSYTGKEIIPLKFIEITLVQDNAYLVKNSDSKYGIYSLDGNLLLDTNYTDISFTKAGFIEVQEHPGEPYKQIT